jgi:hypothetical protein
MTITDEHIRREAAIRHFWSDHGLNLAYRRATGAASFSLRQLIAFVRAMPADEFVACTNGAATCAQCR